MCLRLITFVLTTFLVAGTPFIAQGQGGVTNAESSLSSADDPVSPVTPTPSTVIPPAVPQRPTPPAPTSIGAAQSLPVPQFLFVKPTLSWRAKAQDLKSNDQAACRVIQGDYDDVLMSLLACLPQFNLKVESLNSSAGEILAAPLDASSNQRIIFTLTDMPAGSVTVKAAAMQSYKQINGTLQNVLQAVNPTGAARGQSL